MVTFEAGKSYGNDLTVEVISRTEKTITIKSTFGTNRVKVRNYHDDEETIIFRSWSIGAKDAFNKEKAQRNAMYRAYSS